MQLIDARTGVCSLPINFLFFWECKQLYDARKVQEDFYECLPRLEIYGEGTKCVPAGSINAVW